MVPGPQVMQVRTVGVIISFKATFVPKKTFAKVPMTFVTCPLSPHLLQETILGIRVYTQFAVITIFADPINRVTQMSTTSGRLTPVIRQRNVTFMTVTFRNIQNTPPPLTVPPTTGISGTKTNDGVEFKFTKTESRLEALRRPSPTKQVFVVPLTDTTVKVATKKKVTTCKGWPRKNLT